MGWDKIERYDDCAYCGEHYLSYYSEDHDSFNYNRCSKFYDCPICGEAKYVDKYKKQYENKKLEYLDFLSIDEESINKIVNDEQELLIKFNKIFKALPVEVKYICNHNFCMLKWGYSTTIGWSKKDMYNILYNNCHYLSSYSRFNKDFKGLSGYDILQKLFKFTHEEYNKYISIKINPTKTYEEQKIDFEKELKCIENKYKNSVELYHRYRENKNIK